MKIRRNGKSRRQLLVVSSVMIEAGTAREFALVLQLTMSRHAVILVITSVSYNKTAVIRKDFHVMCVRYIYYT